MSVAWTSEPKIGENKTLITDAGPSRGPILRSGEPDLVVQEFSAWLAVAHLLCWAVPAAAGVAVDRPVDAGRVSFTATRHEVTRSMAQSLVTAGTTTVEALDAAAQQAARAVLTRLLSRAERLELGSGYSRCLRGVVPSWNEATSTSTGRLIYGCQA